MSFLSTLDQVPLFHHVVRLLHLRDAAAWWLKRSPKIGRLPKTGAVYASRYLESILLADEIFNRNVYLDAIDPAKTRTFADLGSNVGYLCPLLRELTGRKDLKGIMVDANPQMVEESDWHIRNNAMPGVKAVHGLAGAAHEGESVDFYLLPSNLGSSQFDVFEPGKPPKGKWRKISVPKIDLEQTWLREVGDVRCDFCKMDIEGSELALLQQSPDFFARVDRLVVEWHSWIAPHDKLKAILESQGFHLVRIVEELAQTGIAWYARDTA
jgi:FkbM family methyltransferase